jgi:hypothetical protein
MFSIHWLVRMAAGLERFGHTLEKKGDKLNQQRPN